MHRAEGKGTGVKGWKKGPPTRGRSTPYWMIGPLFLILCVFAIYPLIYNFVLSLRNVVLYRPDYRPFVGFANYADVLSSFYFRESVTTTFVYMLLVLAGTTFVGLSMALLMARPGRSASIFRVLVILPWAVPITVAGTIWKWIWNGDFGLLNAALHQLGLIDSYQPWLAGAGTALLAIAVAAIWRETPLSAILLLGGLQTIPQELYEAMDMDGGGTYHKFRFITIPLLKPILLVVMVFQTINALITFDLVYVMTGGGPGTATQLLSWYAYAETFTFLNLGNGAAMAFVLAAIIVLIVALYFKFIRVEEVY